jgi:LPXTG-motif cell wall-anchored protein
VIKTVLLLIIGVAILVGAGLFVMRKKERTSHDRGANIASRDGTFSVLQGEVDGHPVFATIDMGLRDLPDKQRLPFFLSLKTPLINPTSDGLPSRSDADNLNTWEDAVEARLRSTGEFVFVGRVTWNRNRELLYYLNSWQPSMKALQSLSDAHSTRPFAFICERDEKWEQAGFWLNRK